MESFSSRHNNWKDPRPPRISKASKEKKLMHLRRIWNAGSLIRRLIAQSTTLASHDAVHDRPPLGSALEPIEIFSDSDQDDGDDDDDGDGEGHVDSNSNYNLASKKSKERNRQDDVSQTVAHDQVVENELVDRFWDHLHPPPHLLGDKEALLAFYLDEWSPETTPRIRSAVEARLAVRKRSIGQQQELKDYNSDMEISSGSEPQE